MRGLDILGADIDKAALVKTGGGALVDFAANLLKPDPAAPASPTVPGAAPAPPALPGAGTPAPKGGADAGKKGEGKKDNGAESGGEEEGLLSGNIGPLKIWQALLGAVAAVGAAAAFVLLRKRK